MQFETFFGNKKLLEIPASYLQGYCYHNITGIKCRDLQTTLYKVFTYKIIYIYIYMYIYYIYKDIAIIISLEIKCRDLQTTLYKVNTYKIIYIYIYIYYIYKDIVIIISLELNVETFKLHFIR